MKRIVSSEMMDIPDGVKIKVNAKIIEFEGPCGKLTRNFNHLNLHFQLIEDGLTGKSKLKIEASFASRKTSAAIRTALGHLQNVISSLRKSSMDATDTDPSSLSSQCDAKTISFASASYKSVILDDWWLVKAHGNRISVAGFSTRHGLGKRVFRSAPICRRIDDTTVEATDGITITMSSFINRSRTHQNGIPFLVCNRFQIGFPYDWEKFVAQCYGEESTKRGIPTRNTGFVEHNISSGTTAMPLTFYDIPASQLRDLVMRLPEDYGNCICDVILGNVSGNAFKHTSVSPLPNLEKDNSFATVNAGMNETIRNNKKAKIDKMHINDADGRILDSENTENELTQSKGIVTRNMYKSRNLGSKQEENLLSYSLINHKNSGNKPEKKVPSNYSIESEISSPLSPSAADKNLSGGVAIASRASSKNILCRPNKETETHDTSTVRSSSRLKIRKNYSGLES